MGKRRGFKRADRVGKQIHEVVARLFLSEVNDPRLEEVEIREVDLTPDLRNARVYYTLMNGEQPEPDVKEALDGVAGFMRSQLGDQLGLKYIPKVEFYFDESAVKGRRIDELLSNLGDD